VLVRYLEFFDIKLVNLRVYIKLFKDNNLFLIEKMVTDKVVIKKPFPIGKVILWVFLILLVVGIVYVIFFLGAIFGSGGGSLEPVIIENPLVEILERYEEQGIQINQDEIIEQAEMEFDQDYINYVLFAMSAWRLHNPPFSTDTPKIKVVLDGNDLYLSEVIDGSISTNGGNVEEFDIVITSTKNEIIKAMLSEDMTDFMQTSVREGRTGIEVIAGYVTLATKGYVQMYEDVTGESLI
jgi:hypothetical protein